ncbi:MAG: xylulokinase [Microbacteriaceae bacterium]|nr:xylulokinase [Microbacteriaceae bacterium]
MTLVAGIDSSTQSCKVVIRDLETGATVRTGRAAHPEGTEVHPQAWWIALESAVADAGGLNDVASISIAAQQHGLVTLDVHGEVIRPALLWNDTRSSGSAENLIAEIGAEEFAARTGSVPVASFTITKLRWMADEEPANAARIAAIALPHDWLTWRMRGYGPENPTLTELVTDRSDASGTGYFSPKSGEYDRELVSLALKFDASDIVLPVVLAAGDHRTIAVDSTHFRGGLIIGVGAGDNAGAALGLNATLGDAVVSIGTSGTVFGVSQLPARDASGAVAGFSSATGDFLPLVATLNAARILDSISSLLGVDHNGLAELALQAPSGCEGLVLVPYFEGERTPNLPNATASLVGMTLRSATRENLARAAVEGLLCGLADGLDALRQQGLEVTRVLLIGGAAGNPAVAHVAAEVFNVPVVIPQPGEYVAIGAAAQAAHALTGNWPHWPLAVVDTTPSAYQPIIRGQYADAIAGLGLTPGAPIS